MPLTRPRMKTKRRNGVETQSGNEERGRGRAVEGETRGQEWTRLFLSLSPCLPLSRSPALPLSRSPSNSLPDSVSPRGCGLAQEQRGSVEGEAEFESGAHAHRLPVLNRRMKAYFLGRLDRGLSQSARQPAHRADVVDKPVGAEDDSQHDRALDFALTGLFGVFGFFTIENRWS